MFAPRPRAHPAKGLPPPPPDQVRILEDRTGVVLNGLEEAQVRSASDIFSLLDQGTAKRRTAETLLNKQSSRSHTVFVITVSVRCVWGGWGEGGVEGAALVWKPSRQLVPRRAPFTQSRGDCIAWHHGSKAAPAAR